MRKFGDVEHIAGKKTIGDIKRKDGPVVDVRAHGAIGDGITNDYTAITAAIAEAEALGGATVLFPAGEYYIGDPQSNKFTITSNNIHLVGESGATIISDPDSSESYMWVVSASGSVATGVALSVNANKGDATITVADGSLFASGDWILVASEEEIPYYTTNYFYQGEIKEIFSVVGNNITFCEALYEDYATADNVTIRKITFCENFRVDGLGFRGNDDIYSQIAVHMSFCKDFSISGCKFDYYDLCVIDISSSINGIIHGNISNSVYFDGVHGSNFDCIVLYDACQWITISDNIARRGRHLLDTSAHNTVLAPYGVYFGEPRFVTCIGNHAYDMALSAYNHHGAGRYIVIDGNTATNCVYGALICGPDTIVSDNAFYGSSEAAIQIGYTFRGWGQKVTGNRLVNSVKYDIHVTQTGSYNNVDCIIINGNQITRDTDHQSIRVYGTAMTNPIIIGNSVSYSSSAAHTAILCNGLYAIISNNRIVDGNGIYVYGANSVINGNHIKSGNAGMYLSADADGSIISGNIINATTNAIVIASDCNDTIIAQNKIMSGAISDSGTDTSSGISAAVTTAATTPGNVIKKLKLMDSVGNVLGYIAVYDAIT